MENVFHANEKKKKKKAKVAMLISDKNNFKAKTIMRNKEKITQ